MRQLSLDKKTLVFTNPTSFRKLYRLTGGFLKTTENSLKRVLEKFSELISVFRETSKNFIHKAGIKCTIPSALIHKVPCWNTLN
jgi:hypothetical protein